MTQPQKFNYVEYYLGAATGTGATDKTWTYVPATTMTVTVSARSGLRIALRIFWDSLVALVRHDTVTFEMGDETPPYTVEAD